MLGAFDQQGLVAIGAVKLFSDYGEIKRVYVPQVHRGKGLAKIIMAALEKALTDRALFKAQLETGIYQSEAIGLYKDLGYEVCRSFGDYRPDPLSVFMSKDLSGQIHGRSKIGSPTT